MKPRSVIAVTAVGTVRGRVTRRELCLNTIEAELDSILKGRTELLKGAPFRSLSIVVHLGADAFDPIVWAVNSGRELELSVGVAFADVRRSQPAAVCRRMRQAVVDAVVAGLDAHGLMDPILIEDLSGD